MKFGTEVNRVVVYALPIKDLRQYSLNAVTLRQFVIISDKLNVDRICT